MIETLFPLGTTHYLIGGMLVGIGIAIPFLLTGLVAGASTIFTSSWSYILKDSFFQRPEFLSTRHWRFALVAGLVTGGLIYMFFLNGGQAVVTEVSSIRLLIGGLIIGIGTRMSGGCASGHGICGNAALEKVSLVSTLTFLAVGAFTAYLTSFIF